MTSAHSQGATKNEDFDPEDVASPEVRAQRLAAARRKLGHQE